MNEMALQIGSLVARETYTTLANTFFFSSSTFIVRNVS